MSDIKVPELKPDIAEKLLTNVFDSCQQEPNTIPLTKLESYSEYRRERYSFQKVLVLILLAVFLLLPIAFVSPDFTVNARYTGERKEEPVYEVRVSNAIPVKFVSASIDGHSIAVYEADSNVYTMEPTRNGTMKVRVMLLNEQWVEQAVEVTTVDMDPPYLVDSDSDEQHLTLHVADDGLGVDFEGVHMEGRSGAVYKPVFIQKETGEIVFDVPVENVTIYIPDIKQNLLQLVVTIPGAAS